MQLIPVRPRSNCHTDSPPICSTLQPARVDPKMRIEDIMENLLTLKKEGHFKVCSSVFFSHESSPRTLLTTQSASQYIFLSEIAASAVRRAHAVSFQRVILIVPNPHGIKLNIVICCRWFLGRSNRRG